MENQIKNMENQIKKESNNQFKQFITVVVLLVLIVIIWFIYHLNHVSGPNVVLGRICEEKISIGMSEDQVFEILGRENFRNKAEGDKATYYSFYPENAPPSIIDTSVSLSLKDNKVIEKDCYSD